MSVMCEKKIEDWTAEEYIELLRQSYPNLFNYFYKALKFENKSCMCPIGEDPWTNEELDDMSCQPLNMAKAICTDFGEKEACRIAQAILGNYYEKGY